MVSASAAGDRDGHRGLLLTYKHKPFNKYALKNILPGIIWALGNMFLFISQPRVGVATSFPFLKWGSSSARSAESSFSVSKTKRQLVAIAIGIILIIVAAVFLGVAKSNS